MYNLNLRMLRKDHVQNFSLIVERNTKMPDQAFFFQGIAGLVGPAPLEFLVIVLILRMHQVEVKVIHTAGLQLALEQGTDLGLLGKVVTGELIGQIIAAEKEMGERISNIVMMGIGEPLDNYDNVIRFLRLVGCENGINIGYRHISLSTCGLVDKIERLAKEDMQITISI